VKLAIEILVFVKPLLEFPSVRVLIANRQSSSDWPEGLSFDLIGAGTSTPCCFLN
jgi:hypothetical protein